MECYKLWKESLNRDGQYLNNVNKMYTSSGWTQNILQYYMTDTL
jgi:hypothetical protein